MLVLTRRTGESVIIGQTTTVTVLEVKNGQVRLGVDAPPQIAVHREEIYERIQRGEPIPVAPEETRRTNKLL